MLCYRSITPFDRCGKIVEQYRTGGRMEPKTKLLDQVRNVLRLKHMSLRTEEAYVTWVKRFILFHQKRHPADMGAPEIRAFLTHLAVHGQVAASTQNGALNALLFLYRHVLQQPFPELGEVERAKRPQRMPTVFTPDEVKAVLAQLNGRLISWQVCSTVPVYA